MIKWTEITHTFARRPFDIEEPFQELRGRSLLLERQGQFLVEARLYLHKPQGAQVFPDTGEAILRGWAVLLHLPSPSLGD